MKTRAKRQSRRFLFFAAWAFVIATGIAALAFVSMKDRFQVKPWDEYLGKAEQASLTETLAPPMEDPSSDPILAVPGLTVRPGSVSRGMDRETTIFQAHLSQPTSVDDLYDPIEVWWQDHGLKTVRRRGMLVGEKQNGDFYTAVLNDDSREAMLLLWRVKVISHEARQGTDRYEWPEEYAELFPELPSDERVLEMGRPGYPGYSVLLTLGTSAPITYKIFDEDLRKRGWKPFPGANQVGEQMGFSRQALGKTYRHESAPFGCQLLVDQEELEMVGSRVLLSLF